MSAVVGGPGSVPVGERLLWRGAPDPDRIVRRWWSTTLRGLGAQLFGLALFFFATGTLGQMDSALQLFIGFAVAASVVPSLLQVGRPRKFARTTSYLLTDQRLLIDLAGGRRDLHLVNLPDLRLELLGGGVGSIYFTRPIGASPQRYVRRLAAWIPQLQDTSELLVCVPDAERVMALLNKAQADALTAVRDAAVAPGDLPASPSARPGPIPVEGPVSRQSFMRSASVMPIWFGAAFLGAGLLTILLGLSATPGGRWWVVVLIGSIFAVFGALFVRARYQVLREKRRLRSTGMHVAGRVVDVAATGTQVNDVELWIVRYTFKAGGAEQRGESAAVPWESVARFAPGDTVEVLYDPRDPSVSSMPELADG
jgi:uncharacterized membrane protein HdeD (DUF308 family)